MINQVTKKDCMEAIDYLWGMGMTQEMSSDKKHYTEILLKKVGKRFLKLGATTEVSIPAKNTKYLQLQKLNVKGFEEAQMLAVIEFLNA